MKKLLFETTKILLFINIFLLQAYLIRFEIGPYPTHLQEILIAILAISFIGMKIKQNHIKEIFFNLKKYKIILAFIALTTLSVLFVDVPQYVDFFRQLKFLFFAVVLTYIFLETFQSKQDRIKGLEIMGYGALAFGVFSALYNLLGFHNTHDLRMRGPMDSAVALAFYMAPFFLFFAIRFLRNVNKKDFLMAFFLGLLMIPTRSMGALGGSFLVLLIFMFTNSDIKILQKKVVKVLIATLALSLLAVIFYTKILPTFQTVYSSLDERGEIWQVSGFLLKDVKTIFLGLGFGQFEHHFINNSVAVLNRPPLDWHPLHPHNIFLLFIFNYGILGLALIIFCLYKVLKNIFWNKNINELKIVISFMLLYFFIHGLIDSPFFKNDMTILFILFFELIVDKQATKV